MWMPQLMAWAPYSCRRETILPKHLLNAINLPVLHPVAYYSATFTPTEWNYNIYKRELLAVMKALAHWRDYLGWTKNPFIIHTDNANLQYWESPRNLNS